MDVPGGSTASAGPSGGTQCACDAFATYATDPDGDLIRALEAFVEDFHRRPALPAELRRKLELCVTGRDFTTPRRVHHLMDIPRLLVGVEGFHETIEIGAKPTLTFAGLARVARHVIGSFVAGSPKCEREHYQWRRDLPGTLTMNVAPRNWIGNSDGYNPTTPVQYLAAFFGEVVGT